MNEEMYDSPFNVVLTKKTSYTYDKKGNLLKEVPEYSKPVSSDAVETFSGSIYGDGVVVDFTDNALEITSNTYDGFNRLKKTEVTKNGTTNISEYQYNGDDLRVKNVVKSSANNYLPDITYYSYDNQNMILETGVNDIVKARYLRGINYLGRIDAIGKISYILYNAHGDVMQTVSDAGALENEYDYDEFGNPTQAKEQYSMDIRYGGYQYDSATGDYYLNARYYDSYTGRFITEDSYEGETEDPLSLNLYTYCSNDPAQYTDPTGHWQSGDSGLSGYAQQLVAQATADYYEAQKRGDKAAMQAAHERAADARSNDAVGAYSAASQVPTVMSQQQEQKALSDRTVSSSDLYHITGGEYGSNSTSAVTTPVVVVQTNSNQVDNNLSSNTSWFSLNQNERKTPGGDYNNVNNVATKPIDSIVRIKEFPVPTIQEAVAAATKPTEADSTKDNSANNDSSSEKQDGATVDSDTNNGPSKVVTDGTDSNSVKSDSGATQSGENKGSAAQSKASEAKTSELSKAQEEGESAAIAVAVVLNGLENQTNQGNIVDEFGNHVDQSEDELSSDDEDDTDSFDDLVYDGESYDYEELSTNIMQSDYTEFKNRQDVINALVYLGEKWNAAKTQAGKAVFRSAADEIRNSVRNGTSYNDRTKNINNQLEENADALAKITSPLNSGYMAIYEWYGLVKPSGDWDYKRTYNTKLSWFPDSGVCMYNGKFITAEEFGNINFGYTGTALGFGSKALFTGGGWAAQRERTASKSTAAPYYGDSVQDHKYIQQGINIYYKLNPSAEWLKWSLINADVRPILNKLFGKS